MTSRPAPLRTCSLPALALVLAAACLLAWARPAPAQPPSLDALTAAAIMLVQEDIQTCQEAQGAVDRQARLRADELKLWRDYYAGVVNYFAFARQTINWQWRYRLAKAGTIAQYAPGLAIAPNVAFVPYARTQAVDAMKQEPLDLRNKMDAENRAIDDSKQKVFVEGLGPLTKKDAAALKAKAQKELDSFNQQVANGEFRILYPDLGWVTVGSLKEIMAAKAKKMDQLKAARVKGDPGPAQKVIGMTTRRAVATRRDALAKELKRVETSFGKRTARMERALFKGQKTLGALEHLIKRYQADLAKMEQGLKDGTLRVNITGGFLTGRNLDKTIADKRKRQARLKDEVARGRYRVHYTTGLTMTGQGARKVKDDPKSTPAQKKTAAMVLTHITLAFNVEFKVLDEEIRLAQDQKKAMPRLVEPVRKSLQLKLATHQVMRDEFSRELAAYKRIWQRKVANLNKIAKMYP